MSEPKFYTVFEADSAYLKALGDTNTYFSEFEVRLKTLEALGGKIDNSITSLLDVEKKILETVGGIATTTNDIFELRKEIAKAQGLDVSEDFNIWDVAQQEPPVGPKIFTIRFLNWDGTVLETVEVEEGQTPVYGGTDPTKESDETYNYTFNGWLPEISPANGNVDYVAQFTAVEIPAEPSDDITLPYVTFVAEEAGSTLGLNKLFTYQTLQYSTDKSTWNTLNTSTNVTLANVGDEVYVRGKLKNRKASWSDYTNFKMTGKIAAYGNCNALWDYENLDGALKEWCGLKIFSNCTSLTKAPELPATTLVNTCYTNMFNGCTSLTKAPELPATTLTEYCYVNMFTGCTSLTEAPELPATTLAYGCYNAMFMNCTSLTEAPELPATTLGAYCYNSMFSGCTSLTEAPKLPATTLPGNCYNQMFMNCTSLTKAPELPATTLGDSCYNYMFSGCTSLTEAPELPATKLIQTCYSCMFKGCTSLTKAPILHATTLVNYCYSAMFYNCTALQEITCLATDISATSCVSDWVNNVSSTGTFYKNPSMTSWPTGTSGIPEGWVIKNYGEPDTPQEDPADDLTLPYVTFRAEEAGSTIGLKTESYNNVEYSRDKITWTRMYSTPQILDNIGDEIYIRGQRQHSTAKPGTFQMTGKIAAYGNCIMLWDYAGTQSDYRYAGYKLFQGCTSLTKAPRLPLSVVKISCCALMFSGCTSLVLPPRDFEPTKIENDSYGINGGCYSMFSGCTSLIKSPIIRVINLEGGSNDAQSYCDKMFYNCTSLKEITCLAKWITGGTKNFGCLRWVSGVPSGGTFYKNPSTKSWPTGESGIPEGWTVVDYAG